MNHKIEKLLRIYITLRDYSMQMKKRNISAYAASTAFFFFLSLMPMLVMVCAIIPYTPLTEQHILHAIADITPGAVDTLAEGLVHEVYNKSAGVLSIAIVATVWSAGKGVMALMQGLNAINGVEEKRNYLFVRLLASFYTIIMTIVIILSLLLMVFGNELVDVVLGRIPSLQSVVSFLMNFRFVFVWFVLTILFAMIYAYIPNRKSKFRDQLTGAMFSAIAWSVFSWAFSLYVGREGAYSIYGSLSIVVITMLWMYFCMYIVMIGAYFALDISKQTY